MSHPQELDVFDPNQPVPRVTVVVNPPKHALASRVLWLNWLSIAVTIAVEFIPVLQAHAPQTRTWVVGLALANIVLRHATARPVTIHKEPA